MVPHVFPVFEDQAGVATRAQLLRCGASWPSVRSQLEARRWQELNERVVVCHNGPLTRLQQLWAAVLSAAPPVAIAGLTGLQEWGLKGFDTPAVHLLVARGAKVMHIDGVEVAVHESRRFTAADVVRGRSAPTTRLTRSVIDAATWSSDLWTAFRILVAPVQQRRETASAVRRELLAAGRVRHRRQLLALANDLCGGAQALSEVEFLRFCRRHGLPQPTCQRRMDSAGRWRYLDATFRRGDGRLVGVEVDGGVHLLLAVRNEDTLKDNDATIEGRIVLRYSSAAIYADDPRVVAQLRRALGLVRP